MKTRRSLLPCTTTTTTTTTSASIAATRRAGGAFNLPFVFYSSLYLRPAPLQRQRRNSLGFSALTLLARKWLLLLLIIIIIMIWRAGRQTGRQTIGVEASGEYSVHHCLALSVRQSFILRCAHCCFASVSASLFGH